MAMQYDVKSTACASGASTVVFAGPARIKGILVGIPSGGGTLTLKNGSAGTTVFSFVAPAAAQSLNISVPGDGIRCTNGIYATTPSGMTVTVFYG